MLRTPIAAEDSHRCQFTFFAITWIWLIGSRQNLAWTNYLTLGTSLRKNFSFLKIQDGRRRSKNLRCVILRKRPVFAILNMDPVHRIYQSSSPTTIIIDHHHQCASTASHRSIASHPVFLDPLFSRVRYATKLSFLFYDHSNYPKLLWELQIDVSIIYSFACKQCSDFDLFTFICL